jgi:hypothetical protein
LRFATWAQIVAQHGVFAKERLEAGFQASQSTTAACGFAKPQATGGMLSRNRIMPTLASGVIVSREHAGGSEGMPPNNVL